MKFAQLIVTAGLAAALLFMFSANRRLIGHLGKSIEVLNQYEKTSKAQHEVAEAQERVIEILQNAVSVLLEIEKIRARQLTDKNQNEKYSVPAL
jgi:hypothetical protein